ncbi:MAG: hypothetical protein AAFQ41_04035 [Cyanobacteria bacterium J06623_7]
MALEKEEALLRTAYDSEIVGYITVDSTEHNLLSEGISYAAGETGQTVKSSLATAR